MPNDVLFDITAEEPDFYQEIVLSVDYDIHFGEITREKTLEKYRHGCWLLIDLYESIYNKELTPKEKDKVSTATQFIITLYFDDVTEAPNYQLSQNATLFLSLIQ